MRDSLLFAACAALSISAANAAPMDLGPAAGVLGSTPVTLTVSLKLRNAAQMAALAESLNTPGSAHYRQFLSTQEFSAQFGPSAATVQQLTRHFQAANLSVSQSATAQLQVTGSLAAVESEFGVTLHAYEMPAIGSKSAYRYMAPTAEPQLAAEIADSVEAVLGLDTSARFRPHLIRSNPLTPVRKASPIKGGSAPNTTDPPGEWTVVDFAQYYDVEPLYARGVTGLNHTLGIITFASFTPSDAFAYWKSLGLKVAGNRITQIPIDGGSGPPSDASGSDETTLDVEQSGGLAPGARILVYEGPNTNQGFVDAFAAAIDANRADTLSTSWGEWEYLDTGAGAADINPQNGRPSTILATLNNLFIQAALQGQTMFAASGDAGAYDTTDFFPLPGVTPALSVDDPAAQPFVTAAGGTTLPGTQVYAVTATQNFTVNIATEQAWGWEYLLGLCRDLNQDPITCGIYPAGSGGGVSFEFPLPAYQQGIAGMATTAPNQALIDFTQSPPQLLLKLPAGFHGRNVPDLSVNADPQTGYTIFYTSDQNGFEVIEAGGTSFSAPQLNGVASLFNQALGHRVGLLNFALYNLLRTNSAYGGRNPPLRDIIHGNNWFYAAQPGYDQATGVGVPNVANLLEALQ